MTKQMLLGMSMATLGYHPACWRLPNVPADGVMRFDHYLHIARVAERGKMHMVFLADSSAVRDLHDPHIPRTREHHVVRHDALTLLTALSVTTDRIGLVCTASSTYNEPYPLARQLATIDHLSHGRVGWNIVTGYSNDEARNFGHDRVLDSATRYSRLYEFLKVADGLWHSWDADAFPRDKENAQFFDRGKVRVLDHQGEHFKVRGPLDVARSPQTRPVLVAAGDSEGAQELSASSAEIVYAGQPDLESARAYYASVKGRMAKYGRDPDHLKVMPALMAFIGRTQMEAEDKYAKIQSLIHPEVGLGLIAPIFGDLSNYDIDGPVPERLGRPSQTFSDFSEKLRARIRNENLTIRQLYEAIATGYWVLGLVGTPKMIADRMEEWFLNAAADGFNVTPPAQPGGTEDFVDLVIPELQRRNLFRTEYQKPTLREDLGLPPIRKLPIE